MHVLSSHAPPRPSNPREVFKMAVMLPTVPFRLAGIIWAVIGVAICNSLAIWGW